MKSLKSFEGQTFDFVCFGEILWDILPRDEKPGGAPMNVAYHLKTLGHDPAIITRVGTDEQGQQLVTLLEKKDISTLFVQHDAATPTGIVHAHPGPGGDMQYEIVSPAAWDNIAWSEHFEKLTKAATYFVFGSLACRNTISKNTLLRLLDIAGKKALDINLRPPFFSEELISGLLKKADVVKMNRAELDTISAWSSGGTTLEEQIQHIQHTYNIPTVVVTLGANGAVLNFEGKLYRHPGYEVMVADTIGSGDAFLAALLSGFTKNMPPEKCLALACGLGALVASKHGAWREYSLDELGALNENPDHQP